MISPHESGTNLYNEVFKARSSTLDQQDKLKIIRELASPEGAIAQSLQSTQITGNAAALELLLNVAVNTSNTPNLLRDASIESMQSAAYSLLQSECVPLALQLLEQYPNLNEDPTWLDDFFGAGARAHIDHTEGQTRFKLYYPHSMQHGYQEGDERLFVNDDHIDAIYLANKVPQEKAHEIKLVPGLGFALFTLQDKEAKTKFKRVNPEKGENKLDPRLEATLKLVYTHKLLQALRHMAQPDITRDATSKNI